MGDLSQHFDREEFACKCGRCDQDTIDYKLIEELEHLRQVVAEPITITSGNRCYEHNLAVGGAPKSKHLFGIAADIKVKGWSPTDIYNLLNQLYSDEYGLKEYSGWVHFDVRKTKWRGKRP